MDLFFHALQAGCRKRPILLVLARARFEVHGNATRFGGLLQGFVSTIRLQA